MPCVRYQSQRMHDKPEQSLNHNKNQVQYDRHHKPPTEISRNRVVTVRMFVGMIMVVHGSGRVTTGLNRIGQAGSVQKVISETVISSRKWVFAGGKI